jgi:hypothetical protein
MMPRHAEDARRAREGDLLGGGGILSLDAAGDGIEVAQVLAGDAAGIVG